MQLENNEYIVSKVGVPDQSITILKSALEKWRDHYFKTAKELPEDHPSYEFMLGFYSGKHEALIDLLKHFEEGI